jgi:anti-sigma B factor antagonist
VPDLYRPIPFRCEFEDSHDGFACIRLAGELDIATVPLLDARLREAQDAGRRRLVVDLRGLDFMDSTGLTLLTRWTLGAQEDGYEFALIAGDERIRRLFDLTQLTRHFTFVES